MIVSAIGKLVNQFHPVSLGENSAVQGRLGSNCWQQTALFCLAAGLTGGLIGAQEAALGFLDLALEGANVTFDAVTSMDFG